MEPFAGFWKDDENLEEDGAFGDNPHDRRKKIIDAAFDARGNSR